MESFSKVTSEGGIYVTILICGGIAYVVILLLYVFYYLIFVEKKTRG